MSSGDGSWEWLYNTEKVLNATELYTENCLNGNLQGMYILPHQQKKKENTDYCTKFDAYTQEKF